MTNQPILEGNKSGGMKKTQFGGSGDNAIVHQW